MLICHKLDISSRAAVLQSMSCVRRAPPCMEQSAVTVMPASWEVVCRWAPHPVLSMISGLSNTTTLQRSITTTVIGRRSCHTQENCMHAEQIITIFNIIFFFCSMYLALFSIVLYRTTVTVYTGNIFLYNYLRQMHQIIHLSLVGCFTPAQGKTVQKNREVSRVKFSRPGQSKNSRT